MAISAAERSFFRKLGSAEELRRTLAQFEEDVRLLAAQRSALTKQHPHKWVGFYKGEVVGMADSLDELMRTVEEAGLPRGKVVTHFLSKKKLTMVL